MYDVNGLPSMSDVDARRDRVRHDLDARRRLRVDGGGGRQDRDLSDDEPGKCTLRIETILSDDELAIGPAIARLRLGRQPADPDVAVPHLIAVILEQDVALLELAEPRRSP